MAKRILSLAVPYLGPSFRKSSGSNKPIHRIVIHATVSPCRAGQARAVANYFRSSRAGGSAHYVVDPVEVVQSVFDGVIAWHAPPNPNSLGFELCFYPTTDKKKAAEFWATPEAGQLLRNAARAVAQTALAYDVPIRRVGVNGLKAGEHGITGHHSVSLAFGQSTHWDPGVFPWRRFMRLVRQYAAELKEQTR